jgi:hypothetical protein
MRGLVMMSTAPYSRALSADSLPEAERLEHITTGSGCWLISFCKKVRPSMRGISISRVMTSGTTVFKRSAAIKGSEAVPTTSISGSDSSIWHRVCRTRAESSTMSTLILPIVTSPNRGWRRWDAGGADRRRRFSWKRAVCGRDCRRCRLWRWAGAVPPAPFSRWPHFVRPPTFGSEVWPQPPSTAAPPKSLTSMGPAAPYSIILRWIWRRAGST